MLTETQRNTMAEFVADYEGGEPEDYVDCIDGTRDPFECYGEDAWATCSEPIHDGDYGHPAVHYDEVQVAKGSLRLSVFVMDFGDVRGVYQV